MISNLNFGQVPKVEKNYSLNKYIDLFIENSKSNDDFFRKKDAVLIVNSFSDKSKNQFYVILKEDYKSEILEYFKTKTFHYNLINLIVVSKKIQDYNFTRKVIKNLKNSNYNLKKTSKVENEKRYGNISNDPYQWVLVFDQNMKIQHIDVTEDPNRQKTKNLIIKIKCL